MSIEWSFLPENSGQNLTATPEHFGDLTAELAAASATAAGTGSVFSVLDRGWIRVSGIDAENFLHNQLTSDVHHLKLGGWQHSSWCTAKGRMLSNFILLRSSVDSTVFELGLAQELVSVIAQRLKMYVLRAKVQVEDVSAQRITFGLVGNVCQEVLAAFGAVPNVGEIGASEVMTVRVSEKEAWLCVESVKSRTLATQLQAYATPVGAQAWNWIEVGKGIPLVRAATREEFVPQMVNFDKIGGVSFHKGCYPGQEIVARTQYLGKVKRHLYRVSSTQPMFPGQPLFGTTDGVAAQSCGVVANAAPDTVVGYVALAVVLETAIDAPIHTGDPQGPVLSKIEPVAA